MRKSSLGLQAHLFVSVILLTVLGISCSQYEYESPDPGILDIRLRVKNSRTDLIPFGSFNYFGVTVFEVEAKTSEGLRLKVLSDVDAIRRKPDGDTLNCLDLSGRDSQLVVGKAYAPPLRFSHLEVRLKPDPFVNILNGTVFSSIELRQPMPQPSDLRRVPADGSQEANIVVNQGRRTVVTVTLDLDSTLVRRTYWFEYNPVMYVSSVQNF